MSPERKKLDGSKKVALVCSGGGTKAAAFHMGVCLALKEKGFSFEGGLGSKKSKSQTPFSIDTYVGSSAGSVVTSYLAGGYPIDGIFDSYLHRGKDLALKPISYTTMFSLKSCSKKKEKDLASKFIQKMKGFSNYAIDVLHNRRLLKFSGIFTTAGIESHMKEVLPSNNFKDYGVNLYIVATQLNHSKRVIFSKEKKTSPEHDPSCMYDNSASISDAVAASLALPPIFTPYPIKNKSNQTVHYFDGEIRETLSAHVAEDAGAKLIISSYTHQPYHYSREIGSLTKFGITAIGIQAIYLLVERKIQLSKYNRNQKKITLDAVLEYCKDAQISETHRKKISAIIEEKLSIYKDINYIYIHPRPSDHQVFFNEHFSLSRKTMDKMVQSGFRATINALLRYNY